MTIDIARFDNITQKIPQSESYDWASFVELFAVARSCACTLKTCPGTSCPHKRGACWSPAAAGTLHGTLLVFDVDGTTEDQLVDIRQRISSYQHLIHSTHSNRSGRRYFRVILPLSRNVASDVWPILWHAVQMQYVPSADPACADIRRMYFFPSIPKDGSYFRKVHEGWLLDVDAVLSTAVTATSVAKEVSL